MIGEGTFAMVYEVRFIPSYPKSYSIHYTYTSLQQVADSETKLGQQLWIKTKYHFHVV
jgi:hypothetical protein